MKYEKAECREEMYRKWLAPGLIALILVFSGCGGPNVIGRFSAAPVTNIILDSLGVVDEEPEQFSMARDPEPRDLVAPQKEYTMQPGDVLDIRILDLYQSGVETTFRRQISETGRITLPEIGTFKVAGRTEMELVNDIKDLLSPQIIKEPKVSVVLAASTEKVFSIAGAVAGPSRYPLSSPNLRILDALAMAGGISQSGVDYAYVVRTIDYNQLASPAGTGGMPLIAPGGNTEKGVAGHPDQGGINSQMGPVRPPVTPGQSQFKPETGAETKNQAEPVPLRPKVVPKQQPAPAVKAKPVRQEVIKPKPAQLTPKKQKPGKGALKKQVEKQPVKKQPQSKPKQAKPMPKPVKNPKAAPKTPEKTPAQEKKQTPKKKKSPEQERQELLDSISPLTIISPVVLPQGQASTAPEKVDNGSTKPLKVVHTDKGFRLESSAPGDNTASAQTEPPVENLLPPVAPQANKNATGGETGQYMSPLGNLGQHQEVIRINLKALQSGDLSQNIVIRPGDYIRVQFNESGVFYIMGQVARPGVYTISADRMTLKQAISVAGLSPLALPSRCDITRRIGENKEVTCRVNLQKLFEGTQPDFFVRPNDMINVGSHPVARWIAVVRQSFRATYGFGFVYDRNLADKDFGH